eukprot:Opistho-1_new@89668
MRVTRSGCRRGISAVWCLRALGLTRGNVGTQSVGVLFSTRLGVRHAQQAHTRLNACAHIAQVLLANSNRLRNVLQRQFGPTFGETELGKAVEVTCPPHKRRKGLIVRILVQVGREGLSRTRARTRTRRGLRLVTNRGVVDPIAAFLHTVRVRFSAFLSFVLGAVFVDGPCFKFRRRGFHGIAERNGGSGEWCVCRSTHGIDECLLVIHLLRVTKVHRPLEIARVVIKLRDGAETFRQEDKALARTEVLQRRHVTLEGVRRISTDLIGIRHPNEPIALLWRERTLGQLQSPVRSDVVRYVSLRHINGI